MTTITAAKTNVAHNAITLLDGVAADAKAWEQGAYKTSNDELYAILARCLDIYQQMKGREKTRINLRKELDDKLSLLGITVRENTNLATKIVRYVFRTSKKRTLAYARVIMSADEHNQDGVSLGKWIRDNSGIEEVRRKQKGEFTATELKQKYAAAAEAYLFDAKALIAPFKGVASLKSSAESTSVFTIALVRNDADGNVSVVYGDNNQTLVKQILARAGKKLTEDRKIKSVIVAERSRKAKRAAAVSKAA